MERRNRPLHQPTAALPDWFTPGWYVRLLTERVVVDGPLSYDAAVLSSATTSGTRPVYLTRAVARHFTFQLD